MEPGARPARSHTMAYPGPIVESLGTRAPPVPSTDLILASTGRPRGRPGRGGAWQPGGGHEDLDLWDNDEQTINQGLARSLGS